MPDNDLRGKERFIDDGRSARVTFEPQCVNCAHNLGLMNCAALGTKLPQYLTGAEPCPELRPDTEPPSQGRG